MIQKLVVLRSVQRSRQKDIKDIHLQSTEIHVEKEGANKWRTMITVTLTEN